MHATPRATPPTTAFPNYPIPSAAPGSTTTEPSTTIPTTVPPEPTTLTGEQEMPSLLGEPMDTVLDLVEQGWGVSSETERQCPRGDQPTTVVAQTPPPGAVEHVPLNVIVTTCVYAT